MKKLLVIEDKSKRKFVLRTLLKIFNYETYILSADAMQKMIQEESPDYVYLNIKEPVNGNDLNELIQNIRSDHRLRVRIINLSDHKLKFSYWLPFENFDTALNTFYNRIFKKLQTIVLRKIL